jgi:two-component system, NtrC family, sensor kinase
MRRRSKAGGKHAGVRQRKTVTRKRGEARKSARLRGPSVRAREAKFGEFQRELNEAAEQQRATAEVLRLIGGSSGDLQPVFASILASAVRLGDAHNGVINHWDGQVLRLIAAHNMSPDYIRLRQNSPVRPFENSVSGRLLAIRVPLHIADLASDQAYLGGDPATVAAVESTGVRATLSVPLFKDQDLVGSLTVARNEVRPFTTRQIEIVQNFAHQAVIAIENARLLTELREALQQREAAGQVMAAIIASPGNLQPVFDTVLENAGRLCDARFANIYRWDGEALLLTAWHNTPPALIAHRRSQPFRPLPTGHMGRMALTKTVTHVVDAADDSHYTERSDPTVVAAVELGGVRTYLAVPMLIEGKMIGVITVFRQEVRPFTDKQIAVMTIFARQVSIAVENARLLQELQETLRHQAAAADVLKILSRSAFDLQAVLDTLVELAVRMCDADMGALHPDRAYFRAFAIYGGPSSHVEVARTLRLEPGRGSVMARTALEGKPVQVADVLADPEYRLGEAREKLGYRTVLGVPLLREGKPIGVIALMRSTVHPFSDKQIELVQNFADQAVVAIENTRLLTELRQRTDQLGRSVAELRRERNNKLMSLEAMTASISHEVRQPLASIAANGSAALRFLGHDPPNHEEVRSALNRMVGDSHRASGVFDSIRALFGKGDRGQEPIDMNALVRGVLDSLHGELEDGGITSSVELSAALPLVTGHKGQLQEVLFNLVHNAIEAMAGIEDGRRLLRVSTMRQGESKVLVAIEDSGPGIDPAQAESIFDAFVTTKAEGSGLGLALCRMIVERHAGKLSASPAQPCGSIFQLVLPAGRRPAAEARR